MGTNQRARVRMTDAEVEAYLHERHTMSMASFAPDGSIHLVAMWYGMVGSLVGVETKTKSQKVRNLRRDPRITVLVESGATYETLKGVEIVGRAELIDQPDDHMRELCASVLGRYTPELTDHLDAAVEAMMHNRVGILVHPTRIVSWDHTKLGSLRGPQ
jgi:PPOX class probable F420-dependent enzyme